MNYLHWDEITLTDFSEQNVTEKYNQGFVFTRLGKGVMHQTRSVRIDLTKFSSTSENRRILNKGAEIILDKLNIPFMEYGFEIGKMAKDFYGAKAQNAFSANKIKQLIVSDQNFNRLLRYRKQDKILGYAICYENSSILHYSYPFYDLAVSPKDMGLIMMNLAINQAQSQKFRYLYLGSLQRPTDTYKLQFSGIEWFDRGKWSLDIERAKSLLRTDSPEALS